MAITEITAIQCFPASTPAVFQDVFPEDHEIPDSWPSTKPYFDYERTWLFEEAESAAVITVSGNETDSTGHGLRDAYGRALSLTVPH